jgi:leucyl-tRNA synthetase
MAVPAHDERDFGFATKFDLPIVQVVAPADGEVEEGTAYVTLRQRGLVNSGPFTGMSSRR